jgi:hypothetical protein
VSNYRFCDVGSSTGLLRQLNVQLGTKTFLNDRLKNAYRCLIASVPRAIRHPFLVPSGMRQKLISAAA